MSKSIIVKINESRSWFFEKINKIDKPLTRLIKKKREQKKRERERTQINTIRNERGETTMDTTENKGLYEITMKNCMPENLKT